MAFPHNYLFLFIFHTLCLPLSLVTAASAFDTTPACKSVFFTCHPIANASQLGPPPACSAALSKTKRHVFRKSDIFVGLQIAPSSLQHEDLLETLLPQDFTPQFSLQDESSDALLEMLSSASSSPLVQHLQGSLCGCGKDVASRIELKICPTSVAGMVELATLEPGSHHLDILDTTRRLAGFPEGEMMVTNVALRRSRSTKNSIICREMLVASEKVSMCYAMEGVENILATMRSSDGVEEITAGMQCYREGEGRGERWCHWVSEDTVVGVLKRQEEEEEEEASEWLKGMKFSFSFDHIGDAIKNTASQATNAVSNAASQATNAVSNVASQATNAVVNTTTQAASTVENKTTEAAQTVANATTQAAQTVANTTTQAATTVANTATTATNAVVNTANDTKNAVVDTATTVKDAVGNTAQTVTEKVGDVAASPTGAEIKNEAINQSAEFIVDAARHGVATAAIDTASKLAVKGLEVGIKAVNP